MTTASGTFSVTVSPQAPDEGETSGVGRLRLDKQFQGDLEATVSSFLRLCVFASLR